MEGEFLGHLTAGMRHDAFKICFVLSNKESIERLHQTWPDMGLT
jgi:hypothetical protein